jgi:hypothetical protein
MIRSPAGFDGGDRIKRYLDYYQPSYGVMMLSAGQFSPALLFAAGEQGVWYDPSDFSTMFQDSAGTTPVTAVEQPVGRILDKSGRGNTATQATSASRPVLSARVNELLATATLATQNVTTRAATYTLAFSGTGTVTASGTNVGVYSAGSNSLVCTAGTLTLTVSGSVTSADLRVTNTGVGLPAYQRVTTSTDYDTTGFPYYLRFDGTDDSMATATFTPGTDKVQLFAGVRKSVDSGVNAALAETSVSGGTNFGSVTVWAPDFTGAYFFRARGNDPVGVGASSPASYPAPITNVLSGLGDIAGDSMLLRVNGVQVGSNSADQGTTNFLAYPLYIGRRGGTTLPFNGNLYSLIVRFGANLDASTISNTETWVNGKTLAY